MGTQQQFCLRWNNHQSNMLSVFDDLFQNEALVDVTLACDGLSIKAHKMVLSACSPYFQSLFLDNPCKHPIVILKDIRFSDLKALMDFMYKGEVNVSQEQLSTLLKTAETLKVRGLTEVAGGSELHNSLLAPPNLAQQHQQQPTQSPQLPRSSIPSAPPLPQQTQPPQPAPSSPSPKRKKVRHRHKSDRSSSQSEHEDSDSHELIEPKVEITEDSVDDERLGEHGAKVMRLTSGRTGTGSISGVTNDFTTNTSQGVSSSQETNSTTESQGFPGRPGNVVNLNTPPLLFTPPGPPATVQSMAPVQSIGQPPVLQGSSQALPPPAPLPILMPGSTMMNLHNTPSTSRQDSDSQKIPERLKPRPCKVCNKVISNARNMLKHMLVHDPVKIPFRCTLCQCEYSREETLRWHLKAKHGVHPPRNSSRNISHPFLQQYHHYYHAVSHRISGRDDDTSELYSERVFSSNSYSQPSD